LIRRPAGARRRSARALLYGAPLLAGSGLARSKGNQAEGLRRVYGIRIVADTDSCASTGGKRRLSTWKLPDVAEVR
jgi:hypothetical protein